MSKLNQKFGKYTLLDRIAIGGMAEVFLAKQSGVEGFEKTLALKRMRPQLSGNENFIRMFLNEAKLAAQLSHPHIVQIYDLGKIGDSYFIAMEYVHGQDMSRIIPKCQKNNIAFPLEYALKIASATLEALHYAHYKRDDLGQPLCIVHRDISPENILVGYSGAIKIADFGIAKATTSIHESDTPKSGEIKGKLAYMSPEQIMNKNVDHLSDIFSLGVVLYEWVSGYKLFAADNDLSIINSIIEGKIYSPSYFKEGIPAEVERILLKSLEKDKKKRYQSAFDMQCDIDAFLNSLGFNPSHVHLSNFMRQLYQEELDKEALEREIRLEEQEPPPLPKKAHDQNDIYELNTEALIFEDQDDTFTMAHGFEEQDNKQGFTLTTIQLPQSTLHALKKIARNKNTTPENIIESLLKQIVTVLT